MHFLWFPQSDLTQLGHCENFWKLDLCFSTRETAGCKIHLLLVWLFFLQSVRFELTVKIKKMFQSKWLLFWLKSVPIICHSGRNERSHWSRGRTQTKAEGFLHVAVTASVYTHQFLTHKYKNTDNKVKNGPKKKKNKCAFILRLKKKSHNWRRLFWRIWR